MYKDLKVESETTIAKFICQGTGMYSPSHEAFALMPSISANNIKVSGSFKRKDENVIYTRIKFENKLTVIYRCVENIVAKIGVDNVCFIPCNELVNEVLG